MSDAVAEQFKLTKHELATVTPKEILESHVDALGIDLLCGKKRHRDHCDGKSSILVAGTSLPESSALVAPSTMLAALERELGKIPIANKVTFLEARSTSPALVDVHQRTAFLRRDNFDARLAARRMIKYWALRKDAFGPENCFLPLTLSGSLRDDVGTLSSGFVQLLPSKDDAGRSIVFIDWSQYDVSTYSRESMLRAIWYIYHVASEDLDVALEKGVVTIETFQNARPDQYDVEIARKTLQFLQNASTLQCRAIHICHPSFFTRSISTLISFFGTSVKMKLRVHSGSAEDVLRDFGAYRISREVVPSVLGGSLVLDHSKWLVGRFVREGASNTPNQQAYQGTSLMQGATASPPPARVPSYTQDNAPSSLDVSTSGDDILSIPKTEINAAFLSSSGSKRGCKSDPRMDKAVATKLVNPDMALAEALQSGGFIFKDVDKPETQVFDTDGRSLSQRKNQLNRRLRSLKMKATNEACVSGCQANPDPRMDRAVEAKWMNPFLALEDALRAGGFVFETTMGQLDPHVLDSDGVELSQRKSQLNRRLREREETEDRKDALEDEGAIRGRQNKRLAV